MPKKYIIAPLVCAVAVALDQISKTIARRELFPYHGRVVFADLLEFRYAENPGMALGFLRDIDPLWRLPLFTGVVLVAVFIILHLLKQAPEKSIRLPVALGFILSGAFGNLIDRYRYDGVVIDFIRVWIWKPARFEWPTFNLADTFISMGIGLLILDMLFSKEDEPVPAAAAEAAFPPDEPPPAPGGPGAANPDSITEA